MNKRNVAAGAVMAVLLAAAASVAAYKRRPVRAPERAGTWQPVESQRSRRQ